MLRAPRGSLRIKPASTSSAERAIDRRPAEFSRRQERTQVFEQFVGVEMVVMAEDLLDDQPPLFGQPLAAAFQELPKTLDRRGGNLNRTEGKVFGHGSPDQKVEASNEIAGRANCTVRNLPP